MIDTSKLYFIDVMMRGNGGGVGLGNYGPYPTKEQAIVYLNSGGYIQASEYWQKPCTKSTYYIATIYSIDVNNKELP